MKEFVQLYQVVTGKAEDDDIRSVVESMIQLSGREREEFPAHLLILARSLAKRKTLPPAPIPEKDLHYGWLLRELLPLLPDCHFNDDDPRRELFICEPPGLAAVINQYDETYAVITWPEVKVGNEKPGIIGSADPTEEEIRQWAYDPSLLMYAQDEEAILKHRNNIPLFIELASDPDCPKRNQIIAIADDYIANARSGSYDRELLAETIQLTSTSSLEDLQGWSRDLQFLLEFLSNHGAVDSDTAGNIARLVLSGRFRPAIEIRREQLDHWWQFSSWYPAMPQATDFLYICRNSGALLWSRHPLQEKDLKPYASPEQRDQYLGVQL